jgi:archaellum component FlaC
MAEINFTLDEFRTVVREEVTPLIEASELRITQSVAGAFAEYEKKYDARFDGVDSRLDKVENRLEKVEGRLEKVEGRLGKVEHRLGKFETELKGHSRLLGQHSKEIMEVKSKV